MCEAVLKMARRCKGTRKDGEPCQAYAVSWSDYCMAHDPSLARSRQEWRRAGGARRAEEYRVVEQISRLKRPQDVRQMLAVTAERLERGEIDAKTANAIGRVASLLLKAMELSDIDDRLARWEKAMGGD
jgi:hypothetical protein